MPEQDVRWRQRFANYKKAFRQLDKIVQISRERPLTDIEMQALIKSFEYTHETAWGTLKDHFMFQGTTGITGSRDATREAFRRELIADGEGWMDMIVSRNLSVHAYNEATAKKVAEKILETYYLLFADFEKKLDALPHE